MHRVDERHDGPAEGRVVRSPRVGGVGAPERHPQRVPRRAPHAGAVPARGLHEQALGPGGVRHQLRAHRDPVDRGVHARADGGRARHDGLGRAHAMVEARRPSAARRRRSLGAAPVLDRLGAGHARTGREDAYAARLPDRRAVRVHRVVVDHRHPARRSPRGPAAHRRPSAGRHRTQAGRCRRRGGAEG